jgi:hypothetical protein
MSEIPAVFQGAKQSKSDRRARPGFYSTFKDRKILPGDKNTDLSGSKL